MVMLEETVRELRSAVSGKAMRDVKDKQQEIVSSALVWHLQLIAAEDKIEELVKANASLSRAKDKQAVLTNKTKAQYARQMARLHNRINQLTEICEKAGLPTEPQAQPDK